VIGLKSFLIIGLYRFLIWSWRIRITESPGAAKVIKNRQPAVLAHWHGDEYSLLHLVRTYSVATMTSTSKDGEIVNRLVHKLGGATARGSSTRGAVSALKGLVRLLKSGHVTSIAVDGPRGPYHMPKPGVFELSRLAGAAIIPLGVHVSSALRFNKAWNKAYLPWRRFRCILPNRFGSNVIKRTRATPT
jgi:lysophospholipid acyltransferase (LPLAT)-like uncharacterized protein